MIDEKSKKWLEASGFKLDESSSSLYTNGRIEIGHSFSGTSWFAQTQDLEFASFSDSPENAAYELMKIMRNEFREKLEQTFKGVIFG